MQNSTYAWWQDNNASNCTNGCPKTEIEIKIKNNHIVKSCYTLSNMLWVNSLIIRKAEKHRNLEKSILPILRLNAGRLVNNVVKAGCFIY